MSLLQESSKFIVTKKYNFTFQLMIIFPNLWWAHELRGLQQVFTFLFLVHKKMSNCFNVPGMKMISFLLLIHYPEVDLSGK